jgi:hypothetical protein
MDDREINTDEGEPFLPTGNFASLPNGKPGNTSFFL